MTDCDKNTTTKCFTPTRYKIWTSAPADPTQPEWGAVPMINLYKDGADDAHAGCEKRSARAKIRFTADDHKGDWCEESNTFYLNYPVEMLASVQKLVQGPTPYRVEFKKQQVSDDGEPVYRQWCWLLTDIVKLGELV